MPQYQSSEYDDEYGEDNNLPARKGAEPPDRYTARETGGEDEDPGGDDRDAPGGEQARAPEEDEPEYVEAEWRDVPDDEDEGGEQGAPRDEAGSIVQKAKEAAARAAEASKRAGSKTAEAAKSATEAGVSHARAGTSRAAGATKGAAKAAYGEAKGGAKAYMDYSAKMAEARPAPRGGGPPPTKGGPPLLESPGEGLPPGMRRPSRSRGVDGYGRTRDEPTPEMMMGRAATPEPRDGIVGPDEGAVMFGGRPRPPQPEPPRPIDDRPFQSWMRHPANDTVPGTARPGGTGGDLLFGFGLSVGANAPDVGGAGTVVEDDWVTWGDGSAAEEGQPPADGGGMLDFGLSGAGLGLGGEDRGGPRNDFGVGGWL